MADQHVHIIITGETGTGRAFAVSRKVIRRFCGAVLLGSTLLLIFSLAGLNFFKQNIILAAKAKKLEDKLAATTTDLETVQLERDRLVSRYEANIFRLEQDRSSLLEGSISRLDERSRIIEEIMEQVGIDVRIEDENDFSGGPFIAPDEKYGEHLISLTDQYLDVLKSLPIGRPVPGGVSSRYGRRIDPLVKERAFHPGLDLRGKSGDRVKATAAGVVKLVTYDKDFGRQVILSHGNGFESQYAHLQKSLVKEGEKVQRGQTIGLVGNTGRSTGPHLHYGVLYQGKYVDPLKYIKVADLSHSISK